MCRTVMARGLRGRDRQIDNRVPYAGRCITPSQLLRLLRFVVFAPWWLNRNTTERRRLDGHWANSAILGTAAYSVQLAALHSPPASQSALLCRHYVGVTAPMACYWRREGLKRLSGLVLASQSVWPGACMPLHGCHPASTDPRRGGPIISHLLAALNADAVSRTAAGAVNGLRCLSNQPENAVYGGPQAPSPKRVTLRTLREKYQRGEPISMVTAYDYPSAVHVSPCCMSACQNARCCVPLGCLQATGRLCCQPSHNAVTAYCEHVLVLCPASLATPSLASKHSSHSRAAPPTTHIPTLHPPPP